MSRARYDRRRLLRLAVGSSAAVALSALPACSSDDPGRDAVRFTYGKDPSQYGDLYLPDGAAKSGTIVVIHGGFWRSAYDAELGAPLCADLAQRGWVACNLEYRRVGNGGGWPGTFEDIAAGIDHLQTLAGQYEQIDLDHVIAIGHSAGGHLAAWAAARPLLPADAPGGEPIVALTGVISQAGVLDLATAATDGTGGSAVPDLLGGTASAVPDRYALADPTALLPIGVPVKCVHGRADTNVPFAQSADYVQAAIAAGDPAELVEVPGDHFSVIDAGTAAWRAVIGLLPELTAAE